MMIDLHCHSFFSDGALSPEELIDKAILHGVQYLALTDHDTLEGISRLKIAATNKPIHIINGIELSARWKKYDVHILGLGLEETPQLQALLDRQNQSRITRAQKIGEALLPLGIPDAYEKACRLAGHARVGRPYFAQLLVDAGKAVDIQSAFKQYLLRNRPAHVVSHWASLEEVVHCIVESGGKAAIAHPLKYGLTRTKLHALIEEFKAHGGIGIEVVSGQMTTLQLKEATGLCLRFQLQASSGSDFHKDMPHYVSLGKQLPLPPQCPPIWQDWIT